MDFTLHIPGRCFLAYIRLRAHIITCYDLSARRRPCLVRSYVLPREYAVCSVATRCTAPYLTGSHAIAIAILINGDCCQLPHQKIHMPNYLCPRSKRKEEKKKNPQLPGRNKKKYKKTAQGAAGVRLSINLKCILANDVSCTPSARLHRQLPPHFYLSPLASCAALHCVLVRANSTS